jgi:N-acetylneuraminic acid mutarotase
MAKARFLALVALVIGVSSIAACDDGGGDADGDADDMFDGDLDGDADAGDADAGGDADGDVDGDADGDVPDEWQVTKMGATLPRPLGGITAVVIDGKAYVLGGVNGPPPDAVVDSIVRYDPDADEAEALPAKLPEKTFLAAATAVGTSIYLLGGFAGTALTDAIMRFDPGTGDVEVMTARLPEPLGRTAAASDGEDVFVFGGNTGSFMPSGFVADITRFDPVADTAALTAAKLPSSRASRIGAIACNSRLFMLGGWGPTGKVDEIVEYLPDTDAVEVLPSRLPRALDGGALACDGRRVFLMGGETATVVTDEIVVLDTDDDSVVVAPVTLPLPLKGHAAVWIGDSIYVLGGQGESGLSADITRITPPGL